MPGPFVHTNFIDRILTIPAVLSAIEEPLSAQLRAIAAAGAVAADSGYAIGGCRQISDAVHYHRSADLIHQIWAQAVDPESRAFAIGWASHWLLDVRVHPLINRLAAEFCQSAKSSLAYAENPFAHVSVEFGFDVVAADQIRRSGQSFPQFELPHDLSFVINAFDRTYQGKFSEQPLISTLRRIPTWNRSANRLALMHASCATFGGSIGKSILSSLGKGVHALAAHSPVPGLLAPRTPSFQSQTALETKLTESNHEFTEGLNSNFTTFVNTNLDTGEAEGADDWYAPAVATRRAFL